MKHRIFDGVHLVVTAAVLFCLCFLSCEILPRIPDAGTPCPCGDVGSYWSDPRGRVVVTCEPKCVDTRSTGCDDAGAATVCFGLGCCLWKP